MNARILPREEWAKLEITGFPQIGSTLRPEDVQIIAVEDGDRLVATMAVLRVTHFESLWIDPEYRGNAGLGRRLIKAGIEAARKWTDQWVWGASDTDHMSRIMSRIGGKQLPIQTHIIHMGGN